ncbi:MAG: phage protein Gp27 family protein [Cyanobacteria bacterium P01_F01_bin.153]
MASAPKTPKVQGHYKVNGMPEKIKEKIDRWLIDKQYRAYGELHQHVNELLAEEGLEMTIGKTSLIRYGAALRERIQTLQDQVYFAQELRNLCPDDRGALAEVGLQMATSQLLDKFTSGEKLKPKELTALSRAMADVTRSYTALRRFQMDFQSRVEAAADKVAAIARDGGVSPETIQTVQAEILRITEPVR